MPMARMPTIAIEKYSPVRTSGIGCSWTSTVAVSVPAPGRSSEYRSVWPSSDACSAL